MKALSVVLSVLALASSGRTSPPTWEVENTLTSDLPPGVGVIRELMIRRTDSNASGPDLGPILVWVRPDNSHLQLSGSLPVANMLIAAVAEVLKPSSGDAVELHAVRAMASLISRSHKGPDTPPPGIVAPWREQWLNALKKEIGHSRFSTVLTLLDDRKYEMGEYAWKVEYSVVTLKGAIEQITLEGRFKPLGVTKLSTTVLAPEGTIPDFEFRYVPPDN